MILGQLPQFPIPVEVGATVADMPESGDSLGFQLDQGQRGAHALEVGLTGDLLADGAIGGGDTIIRIQFGRGGSVEQDQDGKQQDWFQTYVLPIMYVTDPFAILETTGHAA